MSGPEQATVAAILQRFRAFMRYAPMWQEPGILGVEVTMSQAKCLFVASLHPDLPVSALAAHLGVGLSAASGLVDRLVEHGYLARQEDATDRRQQLVSPTAAGTAVVERFRDFSAERMASLLTGLSVSELDALLVGLAAVEREARSTRPTDPGSSIPERTAP